MKKSKLLVGAMALSLAVMGTGYAWWADAVTVNGTVSTGKMNVQLTKVTTVGVEEGNSDKYVNYINSKDGKEESKVLEGDIIENGKTVKCKITNMYPNALAKVDIQNTNNGTIGVKLGGIDVTGSDLINKLRFSFTNDYTQVPVYINDLNTLVTEEMGKEIKPGETKNYTLYVFMPADLDNTTQTKEDTFDITFNWKQFNDVSDSAQPTEPTAPTQAQ